MKQPIQITKVQQSKVKDVDFNNIPFGRVFSDHMFTADYKNGEWTNFEVLPFGNFSLHPASMALHYGQAIFEGMKASKSHTGQPLLFRPEMHPRRLNKSAERMMMPSFPEDVFLEALHILVNLDAAWIPPQQGSALYIRPYMFATDEFIGVRPSETYKFVIFTGPVGPYYSKPVNLKVEETYVRAVEGGTGEAKAAGNYAGSLLPAQLAQKEGFDQVLWMGGTNKKEIHEVGTMNIFFVIDGKVITPALDGAILHGITRDSFLKVLKDQGIPTEERTVTIDEVCAAYDAGTLQEMFGAGTAAVVSHVASLTYRGKKMELPAIEDRKIGPMLKDYIDRLRSGKIEDTHHWIVPVQQEVMA